jgi:drug/metabolite transporter (DMT)-like permease
VLASTTALTESRVHLVGRRCESGLAAIGGTALAAVLWGTVGPLFTFYPAGALGAVYAGVATLALAYALFAHGVSALGSPAAVTISLLEPLTAAVLGSLFCPSTSPGPWRRGAC